MIWVATIQDGNGVDAKNILDVLKKCSFLPELIFPFFGCFLFASIGPGFDREVSIQTRTATLRTRSSFSNTFSVQCLSVHISGKSALVDRVGQLVRALGDVRKSHFSQYQPYIGRWLVLRHWQVTKGEPQPQTKQTKEGRRATRLVCLSRWLQSSLRRELPGQLQPLWVAHRGYGQVWLMSKVKLQSWGRSKNPD